MNNQEHNCWEHARCITFSSIDSHGLGCGPFEHFEDEGYQCRICGEHYTTRELDQMATDTEAPTGAAIVWPVLIVAFICVIAIIRNVLGLL